MTGVTDIVYDGEVPRSFTATARQIISGGTFVTYSGANNVLDSTGDSFYPGSVIVSPISSSDHVVGIAMSNTGSNELVTVNTRGTYIVNAGGSFSGGQALIAASGAISHVLGQTIDPSGSGKTIGTAVTAATSGTSNYTVLNAQF